MTGRWDIAFAGPDERHGHLRGECTGRRNGRELAVASTTSRVVSPVAATPSPEPVGGGHRDRTSRGPGRRAPTARRTTESSAAALNPASGSYSVLGPGLIIGAVLVFLGVALLLRLRTRSRRADPAWQTQTQTLPNGFYGDAPPRR